MSRMRRLLSVFTSLGPAINYTLQATIPGHMLTKCAAALPRPPWEPILYYSTICIMGFLLFCILVASYFEADRIFTADILRRRAKSQLFDKSKVFDLKTIAGVKPITPTEKANTGKPLFPSSSTTPPVEVGNGHIEFPKKKSSWSLIQIFKRLFSCRPSPPEITTSCEVKETKPSLNHSSSNGSIKHNHISEPLDANSTVSTYDKSNNTSNGKTKRAKATKRHHIEYVADVGATDTSSKPNQTTADAKPTSDQLKTNDYPAKTNPKNKTTPENEEPVKNSKLFVLPS